MTEAAAIDPGQALRLDLRRLMQRRTIGDAEARYLISVYYAIRKNRLAIQRKAAVLREQAIESHVLDQYGMSMEIIEEELRHKLARWAKLTQPGAWALSIRGVGPVIAATLCAFIRPGYADNPAHAWRYAGLTPGGDTRYSRVMRQAAHYAAEQFVINRGFYRACYDQRKAYEWYRNVSGAHRDAAAAKAGPFGEGRVNPDRLLAYMAKGKKPVDSRGAVAAVLLQPPNPQHAMLTPLHIERRARRWTAKLFFSHFCQVAWESSHAGTWPMIETLRRYRHTDIIHPPNWPMTPGWAEPYRAPELYPELNLGPLIAILTK